MAKHPRRILDQLDDVLDDLERMREQYPGAQFAMQVRKAIIAVRDAQGGLGMASMHFRP